MLLTIFLAIMFCASITLMLISAVAFVQDIKLFSSAPKEAREVLVPRESELFKGARWIQEQFYIRTVLPEICADILHIQAIRHDLFRLLPAHEVSFLPALLS